MEYATITTNAVDPKAPLVFLIDLQGQTGQRRYVGTSSSGARLPQIGFPWIVERLLESAADDPDWAQRCDWVHFKMLEAWVFDRSVHLSLLENAPRSALPKRRKALIAAHDADLNDEKAGPGKLVRALSDLRQRALVDVKSASSPAELRRISPQRWQAAVQGHAQNEGLEDEEAEADLLKQLG